MNCRFIPNLTGNRFVKKQIHVNKHDKPENGLNKANVKVATRTEPRLTHSGEGKKLNHRSLQKVESSQLNAEVNLRNGQRDQVLTKLYAIIDKYLDPQKVSAQVENFVKAKDELNQKLPELAQLERESGEILKAKEWADWDIKSIKFNEKISQSEELAKAINDVIEEHGSLVGMVNIFTDLYDEEYDEENENSRKEDLKKKKEGLCRQRDRLNDKREDLMKKRARILVEAGKNLLVEIGKDPIKSECLELKDKICKIERILSEAGRTQSEIYDESFKFFMDLVPEITDAVEREVFDEILIKSLSKRINKVRIKGLNLEIIVRAFERMLDDEFRGKFIDILNEYAQRIVSSKTKEEKQSILKKRDLFVYNTLIPPYQRAGEGSCFISAMLMKLWYDKPITYMQIVCGIIERNKANLEVFQMGLGDVDVSTFGQNDTEYHVVYEKLLSASSLLFRISKDKKNEQGRPEIKFIEHDAKFASAFCTFVAPFMFEEQRKCDDVRMRFKSEIVDICNKLEDTKAQEYIKSLREEAEQLCENFSNEFVWDHDRWVIPSLCQRPGESEEEAIKRIEVLIKNDGCSVELAKDIFYVFKNIEISGGSVIAIAGAMESLTRQRFESYFITITSSKNCVIQKNIFQQVLDAAEYGSHFSDKLQKLSREQLLMGTFLGLSDATDDMIGSHFFNFIPKHYNVDEMKKGERVELGYLNYPHASIFNPILYLAKLDNDHVQLQIFNGKDYEPLGKGSLPFMTIHPGFMTKYEDTHLGMGWRVFQILKKCVNSVAVDLPLRCLGWLFGEKLAKLALKCNDTAEKNSTKASG